MKHREKNNSNLPALYAALQSAQKHGVDFMDEFQLKNGGLIIYSIKSEHVTCFLSTWRNIVIQIDTNSGHDHIHTFSEYKGCVTTLKVLWNEVVSLRDLLQAW